ncbi:MAG: hypothetical protein O2865_13750 [Planctomycetota bacterium]|nr:hypothetical protein [Planctomycetota bacterium]MDA0933693.1 hypothetical protein [Planctomycetota bacterium]MDA1222887.1 hypothetical protein [Planctomycetota bacterium]
MAVARVVRLEGIQKTCLLLTDDGKLPEEVVVDLSHVPSAGGQDRRKPVTFRLQPSSRDDAEPTYVEMFDE